MTKETGDMPYAHRFTKLSLAVVASAVGQPRLVQCGEGLPHFTGR